jgi:hypothetical protein
MHGPSRELSPLGRHIDQTDPSHCSTAGLLPYEKACAILALRHQRRGHLNGGIFVNGWTRVSWIQTDLCHRYKG